MDYFKFMVCCHVCAQIFTLMFVFDGLYPSGSRPRMKKKWLMKEEMDRKVFFTSKELKVNSFSKIVHFLSQMLILRKNKKLLAVNRESQEEHPPTEIGRYTTVLRMNKNYITQVFEQIGKNFSQKISKKFSRTVSYLLVSVIHEVPEFFSTSFFQMFVIQEVPEDFWAIFSTFHSI